jgi:multicomponent Na+:H+ antiporter subunit D
VNENLPAIQVVLPLLAAPLCFLIRRTAWVHAFAMAVTWSCFAIALSLFFRVQRGGNIVYEFGDWPWPLAIEYLISPLNSFVLVIVAMIAAVVLVIGPGEAVKRIPPGREYLFYSAFLLCFTGLLGVTITGDAFNIFVFLEIASLATYILVALGESRRALMAAYTYLIVGTIGATFLLVGIGLLYQMTGTLNIHDLAQRLDEVGRSRTILVAYAFVTVGISVKVALFPLHQWLPNAYSYAPSVASAFLAATATKVAFYLLLLFTFTIFQASLVFDVLHLDILLAPFALAAMFVGATAAIYQTDLRRLLAYSSIAQIGYMALGMSLNSVAGVMAGVVHLFNHALMKGGLFLVVACIVHQMGTSRIRDLAGLGKRMPWTSAALVIGGLSLIGVPGTVGFISKWYLVLAALEQGAMPIVALILLSSLLAVIYVWRLIETVYFRDPPQGGAAEEAPLLYLVPTWILIAACIYFGLFARFPVGAALAAARGLMAVAP